MKKILFFFVLMSVVFVSCENEDTLSQDETFKNEVSSSELTERGRWNRVFFDGFNSNSNINKQWIKTSRTDYNSSICKYVRWIPRLKNLDGYQCLRLNTSKKDGIYRSGHVKSKWEFNPRNGEEYRVRARIKLIAKSGNQFKGFGQTYGAWPAFWTVQEREWPKKGEIDIMEGYSRGPSPANFSSNLFYGTSTGNNLLGRSAEREYAVSEGWHTYEMRWAKNKNGQTVVEVFLDGRRKSRYTNATNNRLKLEKFGPHNIILNLNVGSDTGIFDNSRINLFSSTHMYIDWVEAQKRTL